MLVVYWIMKFIKGLVGFILLSVGTFFLSVFILISLDFDPNRSIIIFLIFLCLGMGRLGYSLFTGHTSFPNFSKILNKEKLKDILYKKK